MSNDYGIDHTKTAIIASGISVIGTLIGVYIGYLLSGRTAKKTIKLQESNKVASDLRIALIKTIQRLDIETSDSHSIISEDFLLHDELRRRFELCPGCKTITDFKEAWDDYKYWHDNIAHKTDVEIIYPDTQKQNDTMYKKANKTKPKDLINKLVTLAEYK